MAAWDKLMALPEQQYPSFEALRKRQKAEPYGNVEALIDHKKTDLEFPKHAVPLEQLMPVSDQNIESIAVHFIMRACGLRRPMCIEPIFWR